MHTFTLTINGQAESTEKQFAVINPATEEVVANCPAASTAQVNQAVEAAQTAFSSWKKISADERADLLNKAGDVLQKHQDEIANLLCQEQGKPLAAASGEIDYTLAILRDASNLRINREVLLEDQQSRVEIHRKPLGVIAVITPWNYPVAIAIARVVTALMAGNTVVMKPSPYTPLSLLLTCELLREVLPAGVMNIVAGDDDIGEVLTKHPLVRKISFTGSVETGKAIARAAAQDLKRVTLELGGNDAAIVLDDADVEKIAEPIFWGAFSNTGQICTAIKRLYVHEKVYDELLAKLKSIAEEINVGDGLSPDTQMGPLNNKAQLDIVKSLVEDAKQQGGEIITGGKQLDRPGYFYAPTLVTNVKEGVRLVDEEQFGPVLPIIKYTDISDVVERANSTKMGLGGSVWGSDIARATEIASQLDSGTAWVNTIFELPLSAPFGGVKHSGIGREGGRWGIEELTDIQTVNIRL